MASRHQCSPTSDGSGAAVIASEELVERHGLATQAVEIVGQSMVTDMRSTFDDNSAISLVGGEMTRVAANTVYEQAALDPADVDVIELHDCFSTNELITMRRSGCAGAGRAASSSMPGTPPTAAAGSSTHRRADLQRSP